MEYQHLIFKPTLIIPPSSHSPILSDFCPISDLLGQKGPKIVWYCTQMSVFDQFNPFMNFNLLTVELDNIQSKSVMPWKVFKNTTRINVPSQYCQKIWIFRTFVQNLTFWRKKVRNWSAFALKSWYLTKMVRNDDWHWRRIK